MPDWTYHTIFKPALTRMPYRAAEKQVFGSMGILARTPPGRLLVRMMGHGSPSAAMLVERGEHRFAAPTALGCGVDSCVRGTNAIALFGFGLIEIGPVGSTSQGTHPTWCEGGSIELDANFVMSCDDVAEKLANRVPRENVHVVVRLADVSVEHVRKLSALADGFSISSADIERLSEIRSATQLPIYVRVTSGLDSAVEMEPAGFIVEQTTDESLAALATRVADVRSRATEAQVVIAHGRVAEPNEAPPLAEAGADLVMIQSGFAASGPGLPKRINRLLENSAPSKLPRLFSPEASFFWSGIMGVALFIGGIIATILGTTRVLLPYDEEYLGMLREELCGFNDQILPFMSHDRVTLAGTMLSLGIIYTSCAAFGERRGQRWARSAVLTSSFIGFLSFFLFLGFGYFDPLHAFIAAILFQFILLGLRSPLPDSQPELADHKNDKAWRLGLWGQLIFVAHGAAILIGGLVICSFGVTSVFVKEDLEFMQITANQLQAINPRLVPLVAHDRASFGGMLLSTGVMVLLAAMWGWRRGQCWLWYALAASGTLAYGSTIVIHWAVGYTSLKHLLPAYAGLITLWLGLLPARGWLCGSSD